MFTVFPLLSGESLSSQILTDDEDESMASIVRQRRLPLIGKLPRLATIHSLDYHPPFPYRNTARNNFTTVDGTTLPSIDQTPTDDIASPSSSPVNNHLFYGQGNFLFLNY